MSIETEQQFEGMKAIGAIVANCLELMIAAARSGMTSEELDEIGAKYLAQEGAISAPMAIYAFPGATCISVEHDGVHGVPDSRALREGDLVNIDVSASLNGYFADTGKSFVLGNHNDQKRRLCTATYKALKAALKTISDGTPLSSMGKAVEKVARKAGLTVIKNVGGHGIGRSLHEEPKFIANFFVGTDRRVFRKNSVVAIEPIISTGAEILATKSDGWTMHHPDFYTAQCEHTVMVTERTPFVFTRPSKPTPCER